MPKGANTADAAQNKASGVPEACGSWVQTSSPDPKGNLLVGAGDGVRIGDGKKPCYQAGDGCHVSFDLGSSIPFLDWLLLSYALKSIKGDLTD